jgi:hypothetical protein
MLAGTPRRRHIRDVVDAGAVPDQRGGAELRRAVVPARLRVSRTLTYDVGEYKETLTITVLEVPGG